MCYNKATYAAAANALADLGEWEWCLVLLEELEQETDSDEAAGRAGDDDDDNNDNDNDDSSSRASRQQGAAGRDDDVVLTLELDEAGMPRAGDDSDGSGGRGSAFVFSSTPAESGTTLASYTAAVRACGVGRAGVRDVIGVLERMRWAGVDPGEGTYVEALRSFQLCGALDGGDMEGVTTGGAGSDGGGGVERMSAGEAARALIAWEDRTGGKASVFLYRWVFVIFAREGRGGLAFVCCSARCFRA